MTGENPAASTPPQEEPLIEMGSERLEAFSDAVLAVIMTIMAFGLEAPETTTWVALRGRLPGLFVYVLSFAFVGIYWNNHHHLLRATKRISGAVMWSNLFLLFWLSLIPVGTRWLRSDYLDPMPAMAYGIVALCAGGAYTVLVRSIIRANGNDSTVARAIARDGKGYASLGLYASGIVLALLSPWISYACYATVSVMWFIPDRRFSREG
ncbi:MAG: TMEM175 family protein [Actinomycetota bacterium]